MGICGFFAYLPGLSLEKEPGGKTGKAHIPGRSYDWGFSQQICKISGKFLGGEEMGGGSEFESGWHK